MHVWGHGVSTRPWPPGNVRSYFSCNMDSAEMACAVWECDPGAFSSVLATVHSGYVPDACGEPEAPLRGCH